MNKPDERWAQALTGLSSQRGAVAVLVALSLAVLLPLLALVLDVGQALVAKQRLQTLVDASALAGARQLGRVYEVSPPMGSGGDLPRVGVGQVIGTVADVSRKNQPTHHPTSVQSALGVWNAGSHELVVGGAWPDGIRVSGQAEVPTFVASAMGVTALLISADATAALTGLSYVPAGSLALPFGVAQGWFRGKDEGGGETNRSFALTENGISPACAAWSTFTKTPPTERHLQQIVKGLRTGQFVSPAATGGQTQFQFLGAKPGRAFTELQSLYTNRKDPKTGEWFTVVPVYEHKTCAAAIGSARIVGFATVRLSQTSRTQLSATVVPNQVQVGRGGGPNYGTKGSIPGLVK